jgi:hypothetical protein
MGLIDSRGRGRQVILDLVALLIGVFFLTSYQSALTVSLFEWGRESALQSTVNVTSSKISAERIFYPSGGADQTFLDEAFANRLQFDNRGVRWSSGVTARRTKEHRTSTVQFTVSTATISLLLARKMGWSHGARGAGRGCLLNLTAKGRERLLLPCMLGQVRSH